MLYLFLVLVLVGWYNCFGYFYLDVVVRYYKVGVMLCDIVCLGVIWLDFFVYGLVLVSVGECCC